MRKTFLAAVAAAGLAQATSSAQTPLFFDGFIADNGGLPANNFNGFFQWNVTNGTVDLVAADAGNTNRYVDLAGSSGNPNPGRFATRLPVSFAARTVYRLSFDYRSTGGGLNGATARIGPRTFVVSTAEELFRTFSQTFSLSSATTASLIFQDVGLGADNLGIGIDNVALFAVGPDRPPRVSVRGRPTRQRPGRAVTIRGQATDDVTVARVEVQVDRGPFRPARGTTNFVADLRVPLRDTLVRVRAVDSMNQRSSVRVIRIVRP